MGQRRIDRLQRLVINPLDKLAFALRVPPPGDALLETAGRETGRPRVTPVCDGLDGDTFWIVAQRGHDSDYVRNIEADRRVRVKGSLSRTGWRTGTADILEDDDTDERSSSLSSASTGSSTEGRRDPAAHRRRPRRALAGSQEPRLPPHPRGEDPDRALGRYYRYRLDQVEAFELGADTVPTTNRGRGASAIAPRLDP